MYKTIYNFAYNNFLISNNRYINILMPLLIFTVLQKIVHEMIPAKKATYVFMQLGIVVITLTILFILKEAMLRLMLIR